MNVSVQLAQVAEQVYSKGAIEPPKTQMFLEGIYPTPLKQIKGFSSNLVTANLQPILPALFDSPYALILTNSDGTSILLSRRHLPIDFKKPIQKPAIVFKDIKATEWGVSLHYSKSEIEILAGKFLADFRIDANPNNKAWLLDVVANIVSLYESQYGVELSKEQRKALRNLALRMAYDRLRTE